MKRREARETALKVLYAAEYNDDDLSSIIQHLAEEKHITSSDFTKQIIDCYIENKIEIDKKIAAQLHNWDYGRVAIIDKILLRMAVVEFLYFDTIPPEATINEMIEIGKNYSTERSGKFINGVLDAILNRVRPGKKLNSSGKGKSKKK
jgi:N utilization substance protein B